ncbi:hypothetical protein DICSQDRAFT_171455 [Dichomitus squalens LYAD-421 SS1]|uniref:Uncharacterized protein n=1 Tax=Dichomitus squalens (strain LYAD-421) TaxID=732165 RepID=R7SW26_DICSQ|nr:uncharacterized protein DICSQDRAFT_171455 [Dichomitus squalens LYAD-421 SS1]EJF59970.1 hypothetical protein DICSQDRAFT_171455 [Dichomitus squalens LYAD-421 SS1]
MVRKWKVGVKGKGMSSKKGHLSNVRDTHGAISDLVRSKEGIYQEYFGGITDLLESEPSNDEGHLESDLDWAEMEEFDMAEPDWEPGSEAEQGREQEAEKGPEQAQE